MQQSLLANETGVNWYRNVIVKCSRERLITIKHNLNTINGPVTFPFNFLRYIPDFIKYDYSHSKFTSKTIVIQLTRGPRANHYEKSAFQTTML